jgi:hypothetical protein
MSRLVALRLVAGFYGALAAAHGMVPRASFTYRIRVISSCSQAHNTEKISGACISHRFDR